MLYWWTRAGSAAMLAAVIPPWLCPVSMTGDPAGTYWSIAWVTRWRMVASRWVMSWRFVVRSTGLVLRVGDQSSVPGIWTT